MEILWIQLEKTSLMFQTAVIGRQKCLGCCGLYFICLQASTAFQAGGAWMNTDHFIRETIPQTLLTR